MLFSDGGSDVCSSDLCLWASATLFVVSTVAMYLAVRWRPELVHSLFDPRQLAQFESMYDPAAAGVKLGRDSGRDLQFFGLYIANNLSIGFRSQVLRVVNDCLSKCRSRGSTRT